MIDYKHVEAQEEPLKLEDIIGAAAIAITIICLAFLPAMRPLLPAIKQFFGLA